jgi:glycosyltransferase involved in cell wall biosynthesis
MNLQPKIRKYITWKAINACNKLVLPSQHMHKAALSQGIPSKKLVVIPWGIEHDTFTSECQDKIQSRIALDLPRDKILVLSPRALTPTYNIDTIISACSNLIDRVKEFKLLILKFNPDPDYYRYIQKLIKETHLDPHIIWIEQINDAFSMAQLYSASDLLISIPSSEGYGLSVYEAMSCACPAVISDLDAFSNFTDRYHCMKVAPRDSAETADAVYEIIINTRLRDQIINNSLEFISEMSVDHQKKAALDLYNSVLS